MPIEYEPTEPGPPIGVAVVGLGWWGRIIVPLLSNSTKLKVLKGVDPAPAAAEFAKSQGIAHAASYEEVLKDPAIQGVVLCTPHTQHAEQIIAAAAAKKHVFCEKPLSLSRSDVVRAVKACKDNKVALAVGHEKRFEPPVQELVRLAKGGRARHAPAGRGEFQPGQVPFAHPGQLAHVGEEAPAGPMTATGIHLLDLAVGLLGPAQQVFAKVRQLGSPLVNGDTLGILVTHRSGANSLISAFCTPFDGRFAVYGNKGWAEVRDKAHPKRRKGGPLRAACVEKKSRLRITPRPRPCSPIWRRSPMPRRSAGRTRCRRIR